MVVYLFSTNGANKGLTTEFTKKAQRSQSDANLLRVLCVTLVCFVVYLFPTNGTNGGTNGTNKGLTTESRRTHRGHKEFYLRVLSATFVCFVVKQQKKVYRGGTKAQRTQRILL